MFSVLHHSRWHGGSRSRLAAIASLALLMALPLLAACQQTATTPTSGADTGVYLTPTVTPVTTATLLPPATLSWQNGTSPPGNTALGFGGLGSLNIAPGDGNIAYSCTSSSPQSAQPNVWVTHDRALHWTRAAPLPSVAHRPTFCWIIPDEINPAIAVAIVSWSEEKIGPIPGSSLNFATFDGGQSWRLLSGPQPFMVRWLATYQGVTMAILGTGVEGANGQSLTSRDQMRTWQPWQTQQFWQQSDLMPIPSWINPADGELLALGGIGDDGTQILLDSLDLGRHWTTITTPLDANPTTIFISPPVADQPWRICGLTTPSPDNIYDGKLMCSMDGGHTWVQRPRLVNPYIGDSPSQTAIEFAVAPDGTVYAELPASLYRLAPDTNIWQPLGEPPYVANATVATVDIPGAGILWAVQPNSGADPSGFYPDANA